MISRQCEDRKNLRESIRSLLAFRVFRGLKSQVERNGCSISCAKRGAKQTPK